ncbi:MAG TPA: hypothetical protein VLU41_12715 [Ideonella sp.]|nr:hypothetical protein [Ideonella sp.]
MKPARLDALIWSLVYGGLIAACLGIFLLREFGDEGGPLAAVLFVAGGLAVIAGMALIVVRARLRGARKQPEPTKGRP